MKYSGKILVWLLIILVGIAMGSDSAHAKKRKAQSAVPKYAAIVVDAQTGKVLEAENSEAQRYPASLTKIMTLYMTFQALQAGKLTMNQSLPISKYAAAQSPSKLGLRAGRTITVRDAILGLVTESANDAAVVLAEAIGGTESGFARMMTEQARALSMTRTTFRNASGLPDSRQTTTARDMAILARAIFYHYPDYYKFFSTPRFTYQGATHNNHNHLMKRYPGMDGIKTGFIRASGFNLVATAQRGPVRLIGVVFGGKSAPSRDNQMEVLLDRNFARMGIGKDSYLVAKKAQPNAVAENIPLQPGPGEYLSEGDQSDNAEFVSVTADQDPVMQLAMADMMPKDAADPFAPPVVAAPQTPEQPAIKQASLPRHTLVPPQPPSRILAQKGSWGVQVGAYSSRDASERAITQVKRVLPKLVEGAKHQVIEVKIDSGPVYRARLVGLDESTARAICGHMIRNGQGCLTLNPQE